jgi:hypothetical protein
MEKIDRLGWAAGLAFISHGARIGVRVSDPAALKRLPDHLPPGWRPAPTPHVDSLYSLIVGSDGRRTDGRRPGVRRYHVLYVGTGMLARTMDGAEALAVLAADLHFRVALNARRRLFVRGGAVGWRGRAIMILGPRRAGTTTLVSALVRAGATHYSEDFVAFGTGGLVHPYPKPLIRRDADGKPPERRSDGTLRGRPATRPLPVGLVAVTEYQAGSRWRPQVLSPGQALLALLEQTVLARVRPAFSLKTLQHVVSGAVTLKGKRGGADEVAARLLDRLDHQQAGWPARTSGRTRIAG